MNIKAVNISSAVPGPKVLIVAGVHGDEYEPMLAAGKLTTELKGRLSKGNVIIIPVLNYPAFRSGSRTGDDGLDMARICPGDEQGSASMQIAHELSLIIRDVDYMIDMHTGGQLFNIAPMSGYLLHSDPAVLANQRKMAEAFGLPIIWGTEVSMQGRTLSVARDYNVPAIYVEYGGGGNCSASIADMYETGCLNILSQLGMIQHTVNQESAQYLVEDYTPGAAHLQAKMLSPYTGIFSPQVQLNQPIKKGATWGTIYDPLSLELHTVAAETDGIVLFIRVPALVNVGDSLGGILSVSNNSANHITNG